MSDLSPAAQSVINAAVEAGGGYGRATTVLHARIAAALRAAADRVVPKEPLHGGDQRWMFERDARQSSRKKMLAIADELEAQ
jgi:ribosomal protein S9